jgi:hypothetical protein
LKRWHWPAIFTFTALMWALAAINGTIEWGNILLGGFTGAALMTWAIEFTGNKVPEWLYGSAPRRDGKP